MSLSGGADHCSRHPGGTEMTEWTARAPGPWQQDSAHTPYAQTTIMQEVYPEGFNRGFTETFSRYGMLLDRPRMV